MRTPQGLEGKPRLRMAIGIIMMAGALLGAVAKCHRHQSTNAAATNRAVVPAAIVDVGAVSIGAVVQGALDVNGRQAWTLAATKGQRIAVGLYSAWDNSVSVVMPESDRELTEDGFSGGHGQGLITGVTLPVEGTYRIVVSGENGGAGNYELTVTEAPPAKPGTISTVGPGDAPIFITR